MDICDNITLDVFKRNDEILYVDRDKLSYERHKIYKDGLLEQNILRTTISLKDMELNKNAGILTFEQRRHYIIHNEPFIIHINKSSNTNNASPLFLKNNNDTFINIDRYIPYVLHLNNLKYINTERKFTLKDIALYDTFYVFCNSNTDEKKKFERNKALLIGLLKYINLEIKNNFIAQFGICSYYLLVKFSDDYKIVNPRCKFTEVNHIIPLTKIKEILEVFFYVFVSKDTLYVINRNNLSPKDYNDNCIECNSSEDSCEIIYLESITGNRYSCSKQLAIENSEYIKCLLNTKIGNTNKNIIKCHYEDNILIYFRAFLNNINTSCTFSDNFEICDTLEYFKFMDEFQINNQKFGISLLITVYEIRKEIENYTDIINKIKQINVPKEWLCYECLLSSMVINYKRSYYIPD